MQLVKRIDAYTFTNFLKLFAATFFICLFVFLMQFLWKYVDDMVGKGLGMSVLGEFFLYAALSLIPMALPMSIMLAALMSYGNMGEDLELLAMKSAGISLFRIMRSLIIVISFICIGAFFFSNDILPITQTKMYTLLFSMRYKSPELEIPVGEYYQGVSGYSIFVKSKNYNTQLLNDLTIYDFSNGFNNTAVIRADSGRLAMSDNKKFLIFTLYQGESFENLQQQSALSMGNKIPYRRETFTKKTLTIDFDANFTRYNESLLKNEHVSKNFKELKHTIDSLHREINTLNTRMASMYRPEQFLAASKQKPFVQITSKKFPYEHYNTDSLFTSLKENEKKNAVAQALGTIQRIKGELSLNLIPIQDKQVAIIRHAIEMHRKFALSFACLIFFFIGAPLGAIIRKGGLGMPVVVSVSMFIVYYIIDNIGFKLAKEGTWQVWQGIWLSSAVLLPIGIFLTYKAVKDSVIMNPETYLQTLTQKIKGLNSFIQQTKKKFLSIGNG